MWLSVRHTRCYFYAVHNSAALPPCTQENVNCDVTATVMTPDPQALVHTFYIFPSRLLLLCLLRVTAVHDEACESYPSPLCTYITSDCCLHTTLTRLSCCVNLHRYRVFKETPQRRNCQSICFIKIDKAGFHIEPAH